MKKIVVIFAVLVLSISIKANTIYVSNTSDSGAGSLRNAITVAGSGDTIRFNNSLIANGSDSIVLLSEIAFSKDLVIIGLYNNSDTLKISGGSLTRLFRVTNTNMVHFDSIYMVNANSPVGGGAMRVEKVDSIFITNSFIIDNETQFGGGGGIHFSEYVSSGTINSYFIVDNTTFKNNSGLGSGLTDGGAIYYETTNSDLHVLISNSTFHNNSSTTRGGAIALRVNSSYMYLTLTNSELSNNMSDGHGGGIYLSSPDVAQINTTITGSKIINNVALGDGGGIYSTTYGSNYFTANYVTFSGNSAVNGGGIYNNSFSTGSSTPFSLFTINYSTFNNNSASGNGGGINSESTSSASSPQSTMNIKKSTFTGNSATANGGAIHAISSAPANSAYNIINIENATIFNNSATSGGGIYGKSTAIVNVLSRINPKGSIIAFNGSSNIYNAPLPSINSQGYNIFDGAVVNGSVSSDSLGVNLGSLNLGPLQNNGGTTHTMVPIPFSIAINTGDTADASDAQNMSINANRDRGAAEYSCNSYSTLTIVECDSVLSVSGQSYYSTGVYYDTIPNFNSCDSIITYYVTIQPTLYDSSYISICLGDSAIMNNQTYFSSGVYHDTIYSNMGCDSVIYTLSLSVLQPTTLTIDTLVCESYLSPKGVVYTASGLYYDTLISQNFCDSVYYQIELTVLKPSNSIIDTTVCDAYVSPSGTTYRTSGSYTDVIMNSVGCDSIIQINLIVDLIDPTITKNGTTLMANQAGAVYQWLDCSTMKIISGETNQSYSASTNGDYAVIISNNSGCTDTSVCHKITGVGIRDNDFGNFVVYPNPTGGNMTIDLNERHKLVVVELKDLSGKLIWTKEFRNEQKLDFVIDEPAGTYILVIESENKRTSVQIVKD